MISLCSGCNQYYTGQCDKTLDELVAVKQCPKFRFTRTTHFKNVEQLQEAVSRK